MFPLNALVLELAAFFGLSSKIAIERCQGRQTSPSSSSAADDNLADYDVVIVLFDNDRDPAFDRTNGVDQ